MLSILWIVGAVSADAQTCVEERTLACGERVFDETMVGVDDSLSGYECVNSSMNADLYFGERIYALDVGAEPVTVSLEYSAALMGDWAYELVVLQGTCEATSCLATSVGSDALTFTPVEGMDYWVVVESVGPANEVFELDVSCWPPPSSGEDEVSTDVDGCGGSAWMVWPVLFLGRRRRARP